MCKHVQTEVDNPRVALLLVVFGTRWCNTCCQLCVHANKMMLSLQEAEKLKHENEELRKLGEDAVLDQQLSKALQETDKLKLAADAYKKELLQQKVTELQAELSQANKRLKVAEEENTGQLLRHVTFLVSLAGNSMTLLPSGTALATMALL